MIKAAKSATSAGSAKAPVPSMPMPRPQLPRSLMDLPVGQAGHWYMEDVARNPLLMALVHSAGGYLGGRYAAAPLTSWIADDTEQEAEDRARKFGIGGALLGAVPPALAVLGRHAKGEPWGSSAVRGFYSPESPEVAETQQRVEQQRVDRENKAYADAMTTQAAEKRAFFDVPTQPGTSNMVLTDPYLQPYDKMLVLQAIQNARDEQADQPLVSMGDLARGAVQAGFGYVGAKLLGSVLGLGFGLSPDNQKRLGYAGAVANVLTSLKR